MKELSRRSITIVELLFENPVPIGQLVWHNEKMLKIVAVSEEGNVATCIELTNEQTQKVWEEIEERFP